MNLHVRCPTVRRHTSEYMKVHIFELRRMMCRFDWSSRATRSVETSNMAGPGMQVYITPLRFVILFTFYIRESLTCVKPWTNGLASRRKFKTWVHFQLGLPKPWVQLRWLTMTCAHFSRERLNLQASRRRFFTVWPPNTSQIKLSEVYSSFRLSDDFILSRRD